MTARRAALRLYAGPSMCVDAIAPAGAADRRVGGYDWRLTLTDDKSNWVPIPEPETYDPAEYELVRRVLQMAGGHGYHPPGFSVPNRKTDWKMCALRHTLHAYPPTPPRCHEQALP